MRLSGCFANDAVSLANVMSPTNAALPPSLGHPGILQLSSCGFRVSPWTFTAAWSNIAAGV
jgi:hypothetical protein